MLTWGPASVSTYPQAASQVPTHVLLSAVKLVGEEERSGGQLLKDVNPGEPAVGPGVLIHLLPNWGERGNSDP